MAKIVVLAMGLRELPYLNWAAGHASTSLCARINQLVDELRDGRRLHRDELAGPSCEPYLTCGDPVIAMMAAQVLILRALMLGTGLSGVVGERVANALAVGRALHLERALAWSR